MINTLKALMENLVSMQEHMWNFSREMKTILVKM